MKSEKPENGSRLTTFKDGSERNVADLETAFIGKGTYLPGWRWSKDVGSQTGKQSERHIGYVLSGSFGISDPEGNEGVVNVDEAFELGDNHDAWVIGDEPCIALDFEVKK